MIADLNELEAAAKAAGTTLDELCVQAKVHPTTLWRWRESRFNPSFTKLKAINEALKEKGQ